MTAVVFALELTHDITVLLPLLLAVTMSYGFTVLLLNRSILTEKISRRGYHLSCEYAIDPLEITFAKEVMQPLNGHNPTPVVGGIVAHPDEPLRVIVYRMAKTGRTELPVVSDGQAVGWLTLNDLLAARARILEAEQNRERVLLPNFLVSLGRGGVHDRSGKAEGRGAD